MQCVADGQVAYLVGIMSLFSFSADPGPSRPAATEDSAGVCKGKKALRCLTSVAV